MYHSVVFSLFCCIFYITICKAAPASNDIPLNSKELKFQDVVTKYQKFMQSPDPYNVVVSTRSLLAEEQSLSTSRVDPPGVVLQRCPVEVGVDRSLRTCNPTETKEIEIGVLLNHIETVIRVEDHITCECSDEQL